jgi:1-acyl-sn-glycerol-3-phosphate acyltransferase
MSQRPGGGPPELEESILSLIAELRGGGPAVTAETRLDDLGFDSLAYADLAAAAEERLGLVLPEDGVKGLEAAGDLVALARMARATEGEDGSRDGGGLEARVASRSMPRGLGRLQGTSDLVGGSILRWWFKVSVRGREHVPPDGPAILCMNHESWLDIPMAVIASPRRISFMAKKELYRSRVGGFFLHEMGGFQVDRDAFDLKTVRLALTVLARGEVLGMYPEGTRMPGVLLPFLPGAAWLALRTGSPLVPMAIRGTEVAWPRGQRMPKRVPIEVVIDPAIEVDPVDDPVKRRAQAEDLTHRLRSVFDRLLAEQPEPPPG